MFALMAVFCHVTDHGNYKCQTVELVRFGTTKYYSAENRCKDHLMNAMNEVNKSWVVAYCSSVTPEVERPKTRL